MIANRFADAPPKLEPLEWTLHNGYIYFRQHDRMPVDYDLTTPRRRPVSRCTTQYVTIVDLTQGFQIDGINAFKCRPVHPPGQCDVSREWAKWNHGGGASLVEVDRSLAGNNGVAQLLTEPLSVTRRRASYPTRAGPSTMAERFDRRPAGPGRPGRS